METNHETINNHCNNRTTAHISHKHVHSTLQTTLIQMMLFVWVTPQRCGRKVDRTLCLCIYGKECRIDRTLYSTLLNSTHFFSVVDRTPTHYFWSTGWEVISKSPSHYSMLVTLFARPISVLLILLQPTTYRQSEDWHVSGALMLTTVLVAVARTSFPSTTHGQFTQCPHLRIPLSTYQFILQIRRP